MVERSRQPEHVSTRAKVLALLRRGHETVESLAVQLRVTDNAVRLHLTALEREGYVRAVGVRRTGPGKPPTIYGIVDRVDELLSKAHAPLLRAVIDELRERLDARELTALLRKAGRRAGAETPKARGALASRAQAAVRELEALGAQVRLEVQGDTVRIASDGCVIGSLVAHHPQACAAVAAMVGEMAGADATIECDRSAEPRCRFQLTEPARR